MHQESEIRDPLILGKKTYHDITKEIALPVEGKANKYWWIFGLAGLLLVGGKKSRITDDLTNIDGDY